ncbi:MAG: lytic murein transglycosylase [Elusimicrobiota bacterium]|nr:lytic murein transglycosylase [Elusimicrobiota bacterium]
MRIFQIKFLLLIALFFAGCAKREIPEFKTELRREIYIELSRDLSDKQYAPLLKELINDERFKIYELGAKKKTYDAVPVDHFKGTKFGLLTPAGRRAGRKFLNEHRTSLARAAERFGLAPHSAETIAGLAGIEYSWGNLNPPYRLFNSLISVYHTVPAQQRFALRNIRGLLEGINNPAIEIDPWASSSFMGAVGYCQLMPFWFTVITERGYEEKLDLNGDGIFNPFSMPDAIAFFAWYISEGNYNRNPKSAVASYAGSGSTAKAFADAVLGFADSIR